MFFRPRSIVKKLVTLIVPVLTLYLIVCLAMFMFQRSLIYHPAYVNSTEYAIKKVERDDGYFAVSTHSNSSDQAVVYFGGNAEDVTLTMQSLVSLFPDHAIYAMHYPGFGDSPGHPNQRGIVQNALYLHELVKKKHSQVVVVGRSLGSGVAMQLAKATPIDQLILITPFDSLTNVGQAAFPILPVRWLLVDKYDSASVAPRVTCPVLVLAAAQDEIVPRANTQRLIDSFSVGICEHHVVDPADHNSIELPEDVVEAFLQKVK